ncbi:hypothetical protein CY35_03G064000 [Sphagnum magellanicum]|jgi:predicted RNase H-like nuclease (RuvC/YqgF family)|nr:hypothetical protein CY35_03G064000 [Sphagnum magellanicum]
MHPNLERFNLRRSDAVLTKTIVDSQLQENETALAKDNLEDRATVIVTQKIEALDKMDVYYKQTNQDLKRKLREMITAWDSEKQMMESKVKGERQVWEAERQEWQARVSNFRDKHEQLERDHQALKEELENTKSLMHKAGLGIRLPIRNVRELTDGDVDQRSSLSLPPSRGESVQF